MLKTQLKVINIFISIDEERSCRILVRGDARCLVWMLLEYVLQFGEAKPHLKRCQWQVVGDKIMKHLKAGDQTDTSFCSLDIAWIIKKRLYDMIW